MESKNKIAVTVITGFLGAGKTTFINDVLKNYPETKFALIENEFGDVAVDSKLIKGVEASQMFELKNGCICCTITDEYELALAELAERFPDIGHLLIETTGIADPGPVIRPFFSDNNLKNLFDFNGTVCLADARFFHRYPAKRIAEKQLAVADVVVITKSEDFIPKQKDQFLNEVRQLNPIAGFFFSVFGSVQEFDFKNIRHNAEHFTNIDNIINEHLQVKTFRLKKYLNKSEFSEKLAYIIDLYKTEIYRVKGVLSFSDEPYHFFLQGVSGSFELVEGDELATNNVSEIVIIGNLKKVDMTFFIQE